MADLRQTGAGNQDAGRPMMIPAAYRIIPPARKSSPAIMSADWKTEELPAISKMPRSRLLTVTAAVPVCQKRDERTLGPGICRT